ncbi:hypothetical protein [Bradyrhizobium japonicum]|uniref:hypothetical protein n=1 Tax=Bradyrhizobium japonicum TaxID=375 RepID=UPI0004235591|nr:hypothetical protein [Bradyrhizobium japonicum]
MAIDLGKWSWLANTAIDFGLPILGTALGVPGPVSSFAVSAIKKALGLPSSATPEEVNTAVVADPDTARAALEAAQSDVQAKYAYLTRLAEVKGDVDKANISEINKTIRAETGKVPWWHWRHLLGYLVLLYGIEQVAAIAYTMFGKGVPPDQLATLFNSTAIFTAGLFALLGYVASDTTAMKQTAITGQAPEGVVASTIKAVTGRKK